jgi:hypothetical protein
VSCHTVQVCSLGSMAMSCHRPLPPTPSPQTHTHTYTHTRTCYPGRQGPCVPPHISGVMVCWHDAALLLMQPGVGQLRHVLHFKCPPHTAQQGPAQHLPTPQPCPKHTPLPHPSPHMLTCSPGRQAPCALPHGSGLMVCWHG